MILFENNKIIFNTNDGINGSELWESDGIEADPNYLFLCTKKLKEEVTKI